jgi:mRNA interferase MazF
LFFFASRKLIWSLAKLVPRFSSRLCRPATTIGWFVCISTQTRQTVLGIDEAISISDSDFSQSGLKTDSIFRLTRLAVVSDSIFLGTTGEISAERLEKLKSKLAHWIKTS